MAEIDSTESNSKSIDYNLLNNLMLNEINGKEDSLRHLMSINIILMGAYVTVLANFGMKLIEQTNIIKIRLPSVWWGAIILVAYELVFLAPFVLWFFSLGWALEGLKPINPSNLALDSSTTLDRLRYINEDKYFILDRSGDLTKAGLFVVMIMVEVYLGITYAALFAG